MKRGKLWSLKLGTVRWYLEDATSLVQPGKLLTRFFKFKHGKNFAHFEMEASYDLVATCSASSRLCTPLSVLGFCHTVSLELPKQFYEASTSAERIPSVHLRPVSRQVFFHEQTSCCFVSHELQKMPVKFTDKVLSEIESKQTSDAEFTMIFRALWPGPAEANLSDGTLSNANLFSISAPCYWTG